MAEMKPPPRLSLGLVALREIRRDRAGQLLVVIVAVIGFAVLTWALSSAVERGLDVVVDMDRSAISTGSSTRSRPARDDGLARTRQPHRAVAALPPSSQRRGVVAPGL
jgi:hypothetical protein